MAHYAANLASGLEPLCRVNLEIVAVDDQVDTGAPWARALDRVRVLARLRRYYNPQRGKRLARDLVARLQPDIVHVTSSAVPCLASVTDELRRHGVRVIFTMHDPVPHEEHRNAWGRFQTKVLHSWLTGRVLKRFDAIHVHSREHADALLRRFSHLDRRRFYEVQHGGGITAAIAGGATTPPELAGRVGSAPHALFFGRIEPYKGIDVLLAAFRMVRACRPEARLVVAGGGHLAPIPADCAEGVNAINRFIEDGEIRPLFENAAFVVLPYRSGTQTGVLPLAAAFGLPAVVSRVGALPDLVEDGVTGILVDPGDVAGLAAAMRRLLDSNEDRRRMGCAARSRMLAEYAWPVVARAHLDQYVRMLRER
jgi:glycosyltransferase involved in cell wall biosynthesis